MNESKLRPQVGDFVETIHGGERHSDRHQNDILRGDSIYRNGGYAHVLLPLVRHSEG
jgi:hypothetical protein